MPEEPPHVEALLNPSDHLNNTIEQNLFRWLHTPLSGSHPKVLTTRSPKAKHWTTLMQSLKRFFISPSAIPINYLISCTRVPRGVQLFDLHNEHTKKRLTCSLFGGNVLGAHIGCTKAVVVRQPVSINDDHTFHALENDANKMIESLLYINFKESDIGPRLLSELLVSNV
ncbi:hypothetical protein niasHT_019041 [Heterodera trifolii]|uniref:Uncharacterized protein n=1 Tax=Heterodera trifolii TaxID=157864 RepID=A0ABD2LHL2_9BILA